MASKEQDARDQKLNQIMQRNQQANSGTGQGSAYQQSNQLKNMQDQIVNHLHIQSYPNHASSINTSKTKYDIQNQQDNKVSEKYQDRENGGNGHILSNTLEQTQNLSDGKSSKRVLENKEEKFMIKCSKLDNSIDSERNYEGGEMDNFDYVDEGDDQNQENQNNHPFDAMGGASDLFGGGIGDAMDGGNDGMTALEKEMMGIEDNGPQNDTAFQIRVFINMDEDDDGDKGINLHNLFNLQPNDMPYHIDIKLEDHNNCSELIAESIEQFNSRLAHPDINSPWRLDVNSVKFADNYAVYAAKKKGFAKDDYPSFSMMTNVKKADLERFSVSCFSTCFIDVATFNAAQSAGKQNQKGDEESKQEEGVGQSVGFSHVTGRGDKESITEQQADQINSIHANTNKISDENVLEKSGRRSIGLDNHGSTTKGCCGCQLF